ncbi:dnaJ homolog subfamily C member 5G isoform X2 [Motacilla alba alba]|uniref:dnaJ homolog subfamily C member 5G isoform X2 n=1 Tax=Motacilla alba alba TaxID=1094192 RepID=UPI0018D52487|nr:dnaJ homolog subfamily C member 5G isoform X2 [Motacilla alba alba]
MPVCRLLLPPHRVGRCGLSPGPGRAVPRTGCRGTGRAPYRLSWDWPCPVPAVGDGPCPVPSEPCPVPGGAGRAVPCAVPRTGWRRPGRALCRAPYRVAGGACAERRRRGRKRRRGRAARSLGRRGRAVAVAAASRPTPRGSARPWRSPRGRSGSCPGSGRACTACWGCRRAAPPRRSRRPIGSWLSSTIPTRTPMTQRQPSGSRRSTAPTPR